MTWATISWTGELSDLRYPDLTDILQRRPGQRSEVLLPGPGLLHLRPSRHVDVHQCDQGLRLPPELVTRHQLRQQGPGHPGAQRGQQGEEQRGSDRDDQVGAL